jgi:hypothetical protein
MDGRMRVSARKEAKRREKKARRRESVNERASAREAEPAVLRLTDCRGPAHEQRVAEVDAEVAGGLAMGMGLLALTRRIR